MTAPTTQYNPTGSSSASLHHELQRLFGHARFQGKQEQVIRQVMDGIDTIAVMPTGAGKSLCYQLPAMLLPGATVVISPLIALMKDQYDSLPRDVYERTTFINSTLDPDAVAERMSDILEGRTKLVYCAPERLRQQPFVDSLRRAGISLLVVDEAHCVSMWGHDFRPDYLFLGKVIPLLGHPRLLALTATATPGIRDEIAAQLGRPLRPVVASVFRANLYYEVEVMADKEQKLRRLLDVVREEKGPAVVYARSREACEQLAATLRRSGIRAAHYHAGMVPEDRTNTQEAFMLDRVRVIVATIAFGMGIDKSNVRLIVHYSPPDTLEGYVQESGRAGRDGRPSRCVLFISPADQRNLTRWKRQEQLKVEDLRAIYREIARQVPTGATAFTNPDDAERNAAAALGHALDGTTVRVAISMLERVGLIVRHFDAPRVVTLSGTQEGARADDPLLRSFLTVAPLKPGQGQRFDTQALTAALGAAPDELERRLLQWQEQGYLRFRGDRRDMVIERLRPPADVAGAITGMLEQQDDASQRQIAQMMRYATAHECRHRILAAHLGEQIADCGTSCDHCAPPLDRAEHGPAPEHAPIPDNPGQVIVECLMSFPFNVGKPSLVKALTGSAASNVNSDRVRHFGALSGARNASIERAIDALVEQGYLEQYETEEGYRLLRPSRDAFDGVPHDAVMLKPKKAPKPLAVEPPHLAPPAATSQRRLSASTEDDNSRPPTPEEADLFERLKGWRRVVANRSGLPPYVIFHDKTLWAIARARPQTEEELVNVKGVGQSHIRKYGQELLELLSE